MCMYCYDISLHNLHLSSYTYSIHLCKTASAFLTIFFEFDKCVAFHHFHLVCGSEDLADGHIPYNS